MATRKLKCKGRDARGRIKRGWRLTRGGLVKGGARRRRRGTTSRRRARRGNGRTRPFVLVDGLRP